MNIEPGFEVIVSAIVIFLELIRSINADSFMDKVKLFLTLVENFLSN